MKTHDRRSEVLFALGIAFLSSGAGAAAGCSLSARQIDLAEAYTATVERVRVAPGDLNDALPEELVARALTVREQYVAMLKGIIDSKHEKDGEGRLKRRPEGYRNVMAALDAYKLELQNQKEFGDATLIISVITDFKHRLVVSTFRYRPLLATALRQGTKLLRQIDALTNTAIRNDAVRALNARLTDIHFAVQEQLSESRSCRGDHQNECRDLYEAICKLGEATDPISKEPEPCADRPCWAKQGDKP
jgi:hypothetical protein